MEIEVVPVNILFFARSKELSGKREATLRLPSKISYQELLNSIAKNYNLETIKSSVLLALNEVVLPEDEDVRLTEYDSIAIIPPLSGG